MYRTFIFIGLLFVSGCASVDYRETFESPAASTAARLYSDQSSVPPSAQAVIPDDIAVTDAPNSNGALGTITTTPQTYIDASGSYSTSGGITCDGVYSAYANRDRDGDGIECEQPVTKTSIGVAPSSRSYSGGGTTYVRGYYRKDGTYVRGHTRRKRR